MAQMQCWHLAVVGEHGWLAMPESLLNNPSVQAFPDQEYVSPSVTLNLTYEIL